MKNLGKHKKYAGSYEKKRRKKRENKKNNVILCSMESRESEHKKYLSYGKGGK